ncbi:unnamed protein product [Effrenium voratum]|nr:unnamed protein product [Effrenium voratum]
MEEEDLIAHCEELKERGNRKLAAGDSAGARRLYTEALGSLEEKGTGSKANQLSAVLHSNTAQAFMKQQKWFEAIDQCHAALRFDPSHTKSSWRGATCALEAGMRDVAIAFAENGLEHNETCEELLEHTFLPWVKPRAWLLASLRGFHWAPHRQAWATAGASGLEGFVRPRTKPSQSISIF